MGCAMDRILIAALGLCVLASTAQAQDVTIIVTAKDCARLLRHQPAADVAYQPGIGVKGRKVAPADLPGSGNTLNILPDVLEIPITISPIGWAERNAAMKRKAAAETGISDNYHSKKAAEAALATLVTERTALDGQSISLAAELATLTADRATLSADLALLQAQVDAGTLSVADQTYVTTRRAVIGKTREVTAKQSEVTANSSAVTTNSTAQAAQQAVIDAAPGNEAQYSATKSAAEGTLSALSARGLDDSTMKVGTVRYDTLRGLFTFNDQPMGGAEEQALADACAKRGVK